MAGPALTATGARGVGRRDQATISAHLAKLVDTS
jgi:hypothetical protein